MQIKYLDLFRYCQGIVGLGGQVTSRSMGLGVTGFGVKGSWGYRASGSWDLVVTGPSGNDALGSLGFWVTWGSEPLGHGTLGA